MGVGYERNAVELITYTPAYRRDWGLGQRPKKVRLLGSKTAYITRRVFLGFDCLSEWSVSTEKWG
jgi:hypothetical protein